MKTSLDFDSEPLLPEDDASEIYDRPSSLKRPTPQSLTRKQSNNNFKNYPTSLPIKAYLVLVHTLLGILLMSLLQRHFRDVQRVGPLRKSPADVAIDYETASTWPGTHEDHSIYSGPPNPAQNRAWDDLTRPIFFNVSEQELLTAGESLEDSVKVQDGGYLASTRVFHDVHCLRQIRLYLYKDIYYPSLTPEQDRYLMGHLDHCLESLRLSIMCTGDASLHTFFWHDPPGKKPGVKSNAQRSCIKWDKLLDWSISRSIAKDANISRPVVGMMED